MNAACQGRCMSDLFNSQKQHIVSEVTLCRDKACLQINSHELKTKTNKTDILHYLHKNSPIQFIALLCCGKTSPSSDISTQCMYK